MRQPPGKSAPHCQLADPQPSWSHERLTKEVVKISKVSVARPTVTKVLKEERKWLTTSDAQGAVKWDRGPQHEKL